MFLNNNLNKDGGLESIIPVNEDKTIFMVTFKESNDNVAKIHACVKISSYISMLARIKLYSKMLDIGLDNVLYCDSDSIAFIGEIKEEYL